MCDKGDNRKFSATFALPAAHKCAYSSRHKTNYVMWMYTIKNNIEE